MTIPLEEQACSAEQCMQRTLEDVKQSMMAGSVGNACCPLAEVILLPSASAL